MKNITIEILKFVSFLVFVITLTLLITPISPLLLLSKKAGNCVDRIVKWYIKLGIMPTYLK